MKPSREIIRIIIPVHNRREISLRCLDHLRDLGVTDWAGITVVDDGSTDRTADAIRERFPEVRILSGDGALWWGGATRLGMKAAMAEGADFVFWLNDDCFPEAGALERLLEVSREWQAITTAQTSTDLGVLYGGRRKTWKGIDKIVCEHDEIVPCDCTAGNCVCIPAVAIEKAGLPRADRVPHQWADHDFGLLAREQGIPAFVVGAASCEDAYMGGGNAMPEVYDSWLRSDRPITAFWKDLGNPKSALYLKARVAHFRRHWGWWGYALAVAPLPKLAAVTLLRLCFPQRLLRKLPGPRSLAWQLQCLYGETKVDRHA